MTITISKTDLFSRLQLLSKILPSKTATPILLNFLFEVKGNQLFVTACNEEGRITSKISCKADGDIKICLPIYLLDGLKNLPEQPISIQIKDLEVKVVHAGGSFEMMGFNAGVYPEGRKIIQLGVIDLPAKVLFLGISKVINFASVSDLRPIISSVNLEAMSGVINFVSTNGHGIGIYTSTEVSCTEKISVVISRSISQILKSVVPSTEENVQMQIGSDWSQLHYNDYDILFRNLEGRYPNWRMVVPTSNEKEMLVETQQMINAMKRTMVFSNKSSNLLILQIDSSSLKLSAQDLDYSISAEESLPCEFNHSNFKIGVNAIMLLDMLSCINSKHLLISFSSPDKAIAISPKEQDECKVQKYVLMPMTIQ